MTKYKIAIIGLGHMGKALSKGLLGSGFKKDDLILSSKAEANIEVFERSDWIFLAVKPNRVSEVLEKIPVQTKPKLLISLAAGVKLKKLHQLVKDKNIQVIRVMPNLAIQICEGVLGLYKKAWIPDKQSLPIGQVGNDKLLLLKEKLSLLGEVIEVQNEKDLDVLTIISSCSPAILAYLAQAFANFSGKSEDLVIKSLMSALHHIKESNQSFTEIMEAVATKGGITENILNFLENKKVKGNLEKGLKSGYEKLERMQE